MAEVVPTNQFRNGMCIELEGQTWRIVEFQHVKPGKGGRSSEPSSSPSPTAASSTRRSVQARSSTASATETKNMQYLYDSGDEVVFMDEETYDQLSLPHAHLEDELPFMQPSSTVQVMFIDGSPPGIDLPASVVLEVTETEAGMK